MPKKEDTTKQEEKEQDKPQRSALKVIKSAFGWSFFLLFFFFAIASFTENLVSGIIFLIVSSLCSPFLVTRFYSEHLGNKSRYVLILSLIFLGISITSSTNIDDTSQMILIPSLILLCVCSWKVFSLHKKSTGYENRFAEIIDADKELEKVKAEHKQTTEDLSTLKNEYKKKKELYDQITNEIALYDEEMEMIDLSFYKPHFDFDTSEKYKNEITLVRAKQKTMLSDKTAIYGTQEWTVEGSKAKGKTMLNRAIKLTARAFNNECDAAIANVSWNNITRMEGRITKAYSTISKLNESNFIKISHEYLDLKIDELRLAHEYKEKKKQEREEQAEIKRRIREEAKLEQEAAKAAQEENRYQKLLEKAKKSAEKATGKKLKKLQDEMKELEKSLEEAHSKNERAKSMAQQTRSGHVYIISNIGSFGEDVYKIGMTRRLEPLDRVKELGDASVPFTFDVHAMIYSEDAPTLEKVLHDKFAGKRVNMVNHRKEFFGVPIDDIEKEVLKIDSSAEFVKTIEAQEYTETKAILARQEKKSSAPQKFPEEI